MKKIYVIISLLIINCVLGQMISEPKNIQSPISASLGNYGDIPINYYTGRANVEVPLYSTEEGGIKLEIKMNHETGGVRVNEVPGWVGQNWSLMIGGVITRTTNGNSIDEGKTFEYSNPPYAPGFLYNYNVLNNSGWGTKPYLNSLVLNSGSLDLSPDIFSFNFLGNTGKFFLGNDGTWKVSSNSNLKVEINDVDFNKAFNINNYPSSLGGGTNYTRAPTIGKITIIDDNGNKYIFGKTQNAIEYSISSYNNQSKVYIAPNAWYLSEVIDRFSNILYTFEYERGTDQAQLYTGYKSHSRSRDYCYIGGIGASNACGWHTVSNDAIITLGGNIVKPIFLKTITTRKGNIITLNSDEHNALKYSDSDLIIQSNLTHQSQNYQVLDSNGSQIDLGYHTFLTNYFYSLHLPLNNGDPTNINPIYTGVSSYYDKIKKIMDNWKWRKLNSIQIQNPNNGFTKKINFNYNNIPTSRLKLDNILIDNYYKYSFEYYNFDSLPKFCSQAVDHLGYYNGNFYSLNPTNFWTDYYNKRETNFDYVKYGSLTKITYPLGGSTIFEYEPHDYSKYLSNTTRNQFHDQNSPGIIGGLRIKKITNNYSATSKTIKEIIYKKEINGMVSSGILLYKPLYEITNYTGISGCGANFHENIFSINSIVPISNFSGTHIEYSTVFEKLVDENGNDKGYTKFEYHNYEDYPNTIVNTLQESFSIFDPKTDVSFRRGTLKEKSIYNFNGNILQNEKYFYSHDNSQKTRAVHNESFFACPTILPGNLPLQVGLKGTAYEIYFADNNLIRKETKSYTNSGNINEIEELTYVSNGNFGDNFLKTINKVSADLQAYNSTFMYPFDFNQTNDILLLNRREIPILQTIKKKNNIEIENTKIIYGNLMTFNSNGSNNENRLLPNRNQIKTIDNNIIENLIIDKYDKFNNVLKYHTISNVFTRIFYGYNDKHPILKIEGDNLIDETSLTNLVEQLKLNLNNQTNLTSIQNQIKVLLPEHSLTFYTFNSEFGVTSIRLPNGTIETYNYDSLGRLTKVIDQNGKTLKSYSYEIKN
ncbi:MULTISPECIES: RHS repeat domain-containing protein [Chryseobacterium]|uniref:YD repeat (Two copies) n=1 Tax=Chryseobacterium taihuense TaxID=1141221 RepID=A0A4U8WFV8_9FLAO|nr:MULTISPECIES: RHS repeat domain-containing protein [Chryseobacterium]QQV02481.1 RHS repeat protein [Chryseobacterium sp. FDAARGOS 1104]VFB04270.1 YD repeat (two copies) [Chryseobacterium taihuense]